MSKNPTKTGAKSPEKTQKHPGGRPTEYSQQLATEICERILAGNSLSKVCKADDMPARSSVNKWLAENTEFSDNYVRACKIRRENRFEDLDEVVDTTEDVQRARLKVDVIKWQLSKEEPKKYGDKLDMTTDGKALPAPIYGGLSIKNPGSDINDTNETA